MQQAEDPIQDFDLTCIESVHAVNTLPAIDMSTQPHVLHNVITSLNDDMSAYIDYFVVPKFEGRIFYSQKLRTDHLITIVPKLMARPDIHIRAVIAFVRLFDHVASNQTIHFSKAMSAYITAFALNRISMVSTAFEATFNTSKMYDEIKSSLSQRAFDEILSVIESKANNVMYDFTLLNHKVGESIPESLINVNNTILITKNKKLLAARYLYNITSLMALLVIIDEDISVNNNLSTNEIIILCNRIINLKNNNHIFSNYSKVLESFVPSSIKGSDLMDLRTRLAFFINSKNSLVTSLNTQSVVFIRALCDTNTALKCSGCGLMKTFDSIMSCVRCLLCD